MGYQKPLVMVFQEYAQMGVSPGATQLPPCIVGPCYHIIDPVDDRELAYVESYSDATLDGIELPNNQPGAELVEESVSVIIEEPEVYITSKAQPPSFDSISENVITMTDGTFNSEVQEGDFVTIKDGSDEVVLENAKVIGISSDTFKYILNRSISNPPMSGTFTATRVVATSPVDDFTITGGGDIDISASKISGRDIKDGTILVGYKALRTDLYDINTVYTANEAEGLLGKFDTHENPLGMGVFLALSNTTVGVKCIGVKSDDQAGYLEAQSLLESYFSVYSIVPLTQESAVLSSYGLHASQMSLPEVGGWRVAIVSTAVPTEKLKEEGTGEVATDSESNLNILKDMNAAFITEGVNPGDNLVIKDNLDGSVTYVVNGVISEDMITIVGEFDSEKFSTGGDGYSYEVITVLNKTQQAQEIAASSSGFNNSRVVNVWPGVCEVFGQEVPGYYLACAVAGAAGGLPSHQGFTRLSIGGFDSLKYSNDYFNGQQLDIIAGGGTFIFTQESKDAPPVIRHQLTTDMSTIEFREFSFVKNFDYVSILCKTTLDRFLGQYNINKATLGVLETAVRAVLESLKLYTVPKIGSPVIDFDVTKVHQLDSQRDRVEMYVDIHFPYALNTIGLHLISQ